MPKVNQDALPPFKNFNIDDSDNGLRLGNVYIPEEIILHILSFTVPTETLQCSLVCHKWNNLIKSYTLWSTIYNRKYGKKAKKLPWYLYYSLLTSNLFDTNLLKNGNGEDNFNNWNITENGGNEWTIENPPDGADPLPENIPEFNNKTSCFATSYGNCVKEQTIQLGKSALFQHIMEIYRPHIYLSEWTAGRFDCGCIYRLHCGFKNNKVSVETRVNQWEGKKWFKIEMIITEYPGKVDSLIFEHEGRDTQFWAGHYGSKMAGGTVKLLFDSIEELPTDENGSSKPRKFTEVKFTSNATKVEESHPQFVMPRCRFPIRIVHRR